MKRPTTRRSALALVVCAGTIAGLQGVTAPLAGAAAHPGTPAAAPLSAVSRIEAATARSVAASLADPGWRAQVRSAALASHEVDLSALTGHAATTAGRNLRTAVTTADRSIAAAKGLDRTIGSLLRLRLGTDAMRGQLTPGTTPLVAAATTVDGTRTVTAYDSHGRAHTLSAKTAPDRPVYVIDIDVSKATAAGMGIVDKAFAKAGLNTPQAKPADAGYAATKVDAVYLNDDEETWIEGDAEIFSLVSGFGQDGTVRVDSVDMPYLDNDHTTYYPNQILVNWSNYKYDEADVVMMEDDGDTNYADFAKAIADALLTITDQGAYQPLVDAILAAIPSAWYTNDPDYVDSWYTLSVNSSGTLNGARGNGWMTLEPYYVQAL